MRIRTRNKLIISISVLLLASGQVSQAQAADDNYSSQGYEQQGGDTMAKQPQGTQAYGAPGYSAPVYKQPYYGRSRDYGRGPGFNPSVGSGPNFSGPWDSGRGGSSMPWDSGRGNRGNWMSRDRFADSWDDALNAPSDMGQMPGGWSAPSVSTPNPVDVGDEFGNASRDVPDQMRNVYDDNRRYNSYDRPGR